MGGWLGGRVGGWSPSDIRANLSSTETLTETETELGNMTFPVYLGSPFI